VDSGCCGGAIDDEGNVHGPVVAIGFGEFSGSVKGIDDPHASCRESSRVVDPLFAQDHVTRIEFGRELFKGGLGVTVSGSAELGPADAFSEETPPKVGKPATNGRGDPSCH
jgi:hypothetical protein